MDAASIIASFGSGFTVTRRARAKMVDGRARPAPVSTLAIVAAAYPATSRDLMALPEGRRSEESRTFVTATRLYTAAQGGDFEADTIAADGQQWEVWHVADWPGLPADAAPFYVIVAQARR